MFKLTKDVKVVDTKFGQKVCTLLLNFDPNLQEFRHYGLDLTSDFTLKITLTTKIYRQEFEAGAFLVFNQELFLSKYDDDTPLLL